MMKAFGRVAVLVIACTVTATNFEAQNRLPSSEEHECFLHATGACNATITDEVNAYGCRNDDGYYFNVHRVFIPGGQAVQISVKALSNYVPFVGVYLPGATEYITYATGPSGGTATLSFTTVVSENYLVDVGPDEVAELGRYQMTLTCGTTLNPNCSSNATTACMLNNRFRVTARYRAAFDNNAADADASVKPVTGFANPNFETAFFYFNSASNIEMMVKLLDQGNTNSMGQPTIAVLFGTATPLRVELTIFDTLKNESRTYRSDFNLMRGVTDFTAFVK